MSKQACFPVGTVLLWKHSSTPGFSIIIGGPNNGKEFLEYDIVDFPSIYTGDGENPAACSVSYTYFHKAVERGELIIL